MFVDTSVIIAIIMNEPEAEALSTTMGDANVCFTAPHVRLEACMVLSSRLNREVGAVETFFDELIEQSNTQMIPIDDSTARLAVQAFSTYGKGRGHPAQLNLADCLSYACAKAHGLPILFKGRDFSLTDLQIVQY